MITDFLVALGGTVAQVLALWLISTARTMRDIKKAEGAAHTAQSIWMYDIRPRSYWVVVFLTILIFQFAIIISIANTG